LRVTLERHSQASSPSSFVVYVGAGAIFGMGAKPKSGTLFTEEDWNEVSSPTVLPYYYSKVRTMSLSHAAGTGLIDSP
jgi:hypothetical protein